MPATRTRRPKAEPTQPSPQQLTRELLDISVTEKIAFRTCRRRWWLETVENLVAKTPPIAFMFGEGMHSALEAHYLDEEPHDALSAWYKGADKKLERDQWPMEFQDELHQLHGLGHTMLDNYMTFESTSAIQVGRPIAVEGRDAKTGKELKFKQPPGYPPEACPVRHPSGRILTPVVNPLTREPLTRRFEGRDLPVYLTARIDLLTERRTPKKGLWVVDHKTAGKKPNFKALELDDQITGYCYVVYRMLGVIPRGAIYNVLIKQEPKEPRVGAKGKLSYAKDQLTTPDMYREALREHGLLTRGGKITSEEHAACLASLLAYGWDRFFCRAEITRNAHQIESFEERLFFEYLDMEEAFENHELLYPNPSTWNCNGCAMMPACLAMEDGSDYQSVIDTHYMLGEDRKA